MITAHWPLFDLEIRTPKLRFFYPRDEHIDRLAEIADRIHQQPGLEWWWEDLSGIDDYRLRAVQHMWRLRADWKRDEWTLLLAATDGEHIVGVQEIFAKNFPVTRSIGTGSWVDPDMQGQGYGKEMRAVALHFAFEVLGAQEAITSAAEDNVKSLSVTRSLGYEKNGNERVVLAGRCVTELRFRMTREEWLQQRRVDIDVNGFEPCRYLFTDPGR